MHSLCFAPKKAVLRFFGCFGRLQLRSRHHLWTFWFFHRHGTVPQRANVEVSSDGGFEKWWLDKVTRKPPQFMGTIVLYLPWRLISMVSVHVLLGPDLFSEANCCFREGISWLLSPTFRTLREVTPNVSPNVFEQKMEKTYWSLNCVSNY